MQGFQGAKGKGFKELKELASGLRELKSPSTLVAQLYSWQLKVMACGIFEKLGWLLYWAHRPKHTYFA